LIRMISDTSGKVARVAATRRQCGGGENVSWWDGAAILGFRVLCDSLSQ